ncbi:FAD-dependent oxidoreductase [Phytoactinopolyspora halotolerans]|uniref:FAD-dependent oxidoreductase n=1 Tax=Phytoactinopolyspora halotolerans TaxID=1981512 RepID=A0A6L9SDM2_9ACTN|nr:FAD-dependent oxidoreductase [Phytoactinopolyspora halotolerans]
MGHVVVVGASAAGVTVADTLRDEGHDGRITLIGAEPERPYDRPPLSKDVLAGTREPAATALRTHTHYEDRGIELRTGRTVVSADPTAREVQLDTGETLRYDVLVAATGVGPRRLPLGLPHGQRRPHRLAGVHVLRTLHDLAAFRTDMLTAHRVVVVGSGLLGMEVAATCRGLDVGVTVVSRGPAPLHGQFGATVGGKVAALHVEHGVDLRSGVGVADLTEARGRVTGVTLTDRSTVAADVVLVAVGSDPHTGWLADPMRGLDTADGLGCDAYCRAAPGIFAAGDVARWHHPALGAPVRVEHRMNATEQGICVARNILGAAQPYAPVPYAWTDHYDARIQTYGFMGPRHQFAVVEGSLTERRFVVVYGMHGRVTGALAWRYPKGLRRARELVAQTAPWAEIHNRRRTSAAMSTTTAATTTTSLHSRGVLR